VAGLSEFSDSFVGYKTRLGYIASYDTMFVNQLEKAVEAVVVFLICHRRMTLKKNLSQSCRILGRHSKSEISDSEGILKTADPRYFNVEY